MKSKNIIIPQNYYMDNYANYLKKGLAVVVMHLFYEDRMDMYIEYIKNIPNEIDIIFTVANDKIEKIITEKLSLVENKCIVVKKQNRGRDISALLVAARPYLNDYKYFCFIHDKKEKIVEDMEEISHWNKTMWDCTLPSIEYVRNVISVFENNPSIGVMTPPIAHNEKLTFAYQNNWAGNYSNTNDLLKRLDVDVIPDETISPITLGTVFWARTEALNKLLLYQWDYDDFDDEPLPEDGTLSHAVERCFSYVAQGAGYETKCIYSDVYAEKQLEYDISVLGAYHQYIQSRIGRIDVNGIRKKNLSNSIFEAVRKNKKIYIYGSGKIGRKSAIRFMDCDIIVEGFIVTEKESEETVLDIPVYSLAELGEKKDLPIFIAINNKTTREAIHSKLIESGFKNVIEYDNNIC